MLIRQYRCDRCKCHIPEGERVDFNLPIVHADLCQTCKIPFAEFVREQLETIGASFFTRTAIKYEAIENLNRYSSLVSGDATVMIIKPEYDDNYAYEKEFIKFDDVVFESWIHLFHYVHKMKINDQDFDPFIENIVQYLRGDPSPGGAMVLEEERREKARE